MLHLLVILQLCISCEHSRNRNLNIINQWSYRLMENAGGLKICHLMNLPLIGRLKGVSTSDGMVRGKGKHISQVSTQNREEIALMKKMSEHLHTLAKEAASCGTKLLIDAEHQKYQPAIDSLVLELQQKFNAKEITDHPVIFNTYQCYLKDMPEWLMTDLKRAEHFSFHFAAKLVRGAYMVYECEQASRLKIDSPIHDQCYDDTIELLFRYRAKSGPGTEIMIATHNKKSIEKAVDLMAELGLDPKDEAAHFAQLYGMSDNLTFTLGQHGYNAFKYLPYGQVEEVMPYLLRRALENGDVLGNVTLEANLLKQELKKRFLYRS